jgi:zinc transport system substrate-binding protein
MTARRMTGFAWLVLTALGCGAPSPATTPAGAPLEVFVGIAPLASLVERVGAGHVAVHVLLPPGQNEHTFSLTPKQMLALGKARLFFKIGLPLENQLCGRLQSAHPKLVVVSLDKGITKRISADECHDADHEHEDHDEAGEPDPHVWLTPPLLAILAANIAESLEQADPAHAREYRQNIGSLLAEIDATHARIARLLKPYRGQAFYVFHPAFGYFADTYGLKQVAVEAGGKTPTPRQLRALIQEARADGVKIIFVQPQFDQRSVQVLAAAIQGAVLPLDPLAKDVLKNLDAAAAQIAAALSHTHALAEK